MPISLDILGWNGLREYGGVIDEELHPRLRKPLGSRVFREMSDNSAIIGAIIYGIESFVTQAEWRFETAGREASQIEAASFYESVFEDMSRPFDTILLEILTMLSQGYSYFEIIWKLRKGKSKDPRRRSMFDDGKVGIRNLGFRAQETIDRWKLDDDGGIRGAFQRGDGQHPSVFIPIEKALLFRIRPTKNNPEGRDGGILRNAYRSWRLAKNIEDMESIAAGRDLTGLPVLQVPMEIMSSSAGPTEAAIRTSLETAMQQLQRDERGSIILPSELDREGNPTGYKFRLERSPGKASIDTNQIITRHETRITQSVLFDVIMLGQTQVGTQSVSNDKVKMLSLGINSLMDSIASVFNQFLVPRLGDLNNISAEDQPVLVHGDMEGPDLDKVASFVKNLSSAGLLTPDDKLERRLREMGDLPIPDVEDEVAEDEE